MQNEKPMKPIPLSLIVLAILLAVPASAQQWCAPGATWIYHMGGDPNVGSGSYRYTYEGDTLVDGYVGQRISHFERVVVIMSGYEGVYDYWHDDLVTRTEPGIVHFWLPDLQEWDTLYWFSAEPGDRWTPGWHQYEASCEQAGYLEVVSVDIDWDIGVPVRKLTLRSYGNGAPDDYMIVMERIGSRTGCFIPRPPGWCSEFSETFCEFRCYSDEEFFYTPWPQFIHTCEHSTTVEQPAPAPTEAWSVFPVPFHDRFTVRSMSPKQTARMVLLDLSGRELLSQPFNGSMLNMDAGHLAPGSYVLRLVDEHGNYSHRAVIKE